MPDAVRIGDPGRRTTIQDVVEVARGFRTVRLHPHAARRVELCRTLVSTLVGKGVKVYGITTGFASLRDRVLTREEAAELSTNLIRSHSVGFGRPFPEDVVRASMFLRAVTLARGESGARLGLLRRLVGMLNARVYPYVPEQGSLGSSGDLAPLSHVFLVLMGDPSGRVHRRLLGDARTPAADTYSDDASLRRTPSPGVVVEPATTDFVALDGAPRTALAAAIRREVQADGLGAADERIDGETFELVHKEGLACNNGAVVTAAMAALACHDAEQLLRSADLVAALSFEAEQGVLDCVDARVVTMRPHPGHRRSAENLVAALKGSDLVRERAPAALNMARFNRMVCALDRLGADLGASRADDPRREVTATDRDRIRALRAWMCRAQGTIWEDIRRAVLPGDSAKGAEVTATRTVLEEYESLWSQYLGLTDGDPLGSHAREAMARLHYHPADAQIARPAGNPEVQDNYSFRAAATVAGVAWEGLERARNTVEVEINATTDNPLICLDHVLAALEFPAQELPEVAAFERELEKDDEWTNAADAVLSAANFHGEPIGAVLDHLAATVAEVGNISERRVAVLTDKNHSKGLPSYLSWNAGVNSGFMMPQYTAAALVIENRHLAAPASVDSVPTGEMSEDLNANSTYAARKCAQVVTNVERIVGIELLNAYQGVQFRKPAKLGERTGKVERLVRDTVGGLFLRLGGHADEEAFRKRLGGLGLGDSAIAAIAPCVIDDVVLYPVMEACAALVRRGEIAAIDSRPADEPLERP